jgi:hypothetical protein
MLALTTSGLAHESEKPDKPWKKFALKFGGAFNFVDSDVRLGAKGIGLSIDPQSFFDMDTKTRTFRVNGYWRFTRNRLHRLDLSWYSIKRSAETTLLRDLDLGDDIFLPLGTNVESTFNLDVIKTAYSYSFFQDDRIDLAVSGGLYVLPIKFEFTASGLVNEFQSQSITAPLPVLGLRADFAITPKWFLLNQVDLFYLEYDDYEGGIVDAKLALEYNPFKHVGFGLRAQGLTLKVESEKGTTVPGVDFEGTVQFTSFGLLLYLNLFM